MNRRPQKLTGYILSSLPFVLRTLRLNAFFSYFMYMNILLACMSVYHTQYLQKQKALDPLGLELQVMNCHVGV